ncbi:MAG: mechanosensitive ion channel family protein [Thermosynechococcus sp. Uc]|uniref:mechanosensitive ion channel family protein n=1 Tax=Thermosynechococcus sp. Uc TaxID=3034853 RepID=UPI0019FCDDC9|nr:mechanosensitive ion channel family protein [Thermosynechococcus sp. Uc]MDM7326543.1 mechanosensitive ion channel family protein [Thermosynechococcus sp. Uc]HIK25235.1 mechanosensitive ion channel family protein [Thermosynechococcus sp. M46_R2017_013]
MIYVHQRLWRWGAIALGVFFFTLFSPWISVAQVALPGISQTPVVPTPPGVTRIGELEMTDVRFDGSSLFTIAAPTVRDRAHPGNLIPVEVRAELIQSNLRRVLHSALDRRRRSPALVNIGVARLNNVLVISARIGQAERTTRLLTVTEADSDYHQLPAETLAQQWRDILQEQMNRAIQERTPTALMAQAEKAVLTFFTVAGASLILWIVQQFLIRQHKHLQQQLDTTTPETPEWVLSLLPHLQHKFFLKQRIKLISLVRYLLLWGQVALWLLGLAAILRLFPMTRWLSSQVYGLPILWMVVWFSTGLLNQFADLTFDRLRVFWEQNNLLRFADTQRKSLRIGTAVEVMRGFKTAVIYLIRLVVIISSLGIPVSSILAVGGFLALAISLGSQNLVKDIINGLLIVWEDQYGIGDVVEIEPYSGMVENLNLRITQLRNAEGRLITIPNSTITRVANLTRTWSRVNLELWVDIETHPDRLLSLLNDLSIRFYAEPEWQLKMLEQPEILGIDQITASGLLVRIWIKTPPGQQWAVGREFRRRVLNLMAAEGIAVARLHQQLHWGRDRNGKDENTHPSPLDA